MSHPPRLRPHFEFRVGQAVQLRGYAARAVILRRLRTEAGREMYDVIMTGESAGRPFRTFAGDGLEAFENKREARRDAATVRQARRPLLLLPEVAAA